MSDKSFGDHPNRNIVKNPLLSSAVTGLSLEDLTHKAVLLPVTPSLDQITRSDQQQGSQARTLAHPKHETSIFPPGDAFSNIAVSNTPQISNQNLFDSKKNVNLEEKRNTPTATQSKASVKSDDDFDVNEYIARLQGTRYVSAPLHSHHKDEQNANLEATEENLEEINLNETVPAEVQQSLTADIAQNFSQLPTVLPHVASAVFSSFSNMLSYKSREQTPDSRADVGSKSGYDEVQFQRPDVGVPLMGVDENIAPREVAPPPKEPPIGGSSNFRIATKKKYAQIPGLSSGDASQTMSYPPVQNIPPIGQYIPPIGQNMPPVGQSIPPVGQNIPPIGQNMSPVGQSIPPVGQNIPPIGQNIPPIGQNMPPVGYNMTPLGQNMPPIGQNMPPVGYSKPHVIHNLPPVGHSMPPFSQHMPPVGHSMPPVGQNMPPSGQNIQHVVLDTPHQASFPPQLQHSQNLHPLPYSIMPNAQNVPLISKSMANIGQNRPPIGQSGPQFVEMTSNVGQNEPHLHPSKKGEITKTTAVEVKIQENNVNTQSVAEKQSLYNIFNPEPQNTIEIKPDQVATENQPNLSVSSQNFFTPVEIKDQNIPPSAGNAAIIPPPPMFSNLPRKENQSSGKSVLPPSVARRISANQPIIKPAVSTPSFMENIFVPAPMPNARESGQADNSFSSGLASAFVPAYNSSLKSEPMPSFVPPPAHNVRSSVPPTVDSATSASYFIPSNETKPPTSAEVVALLTVEETSSGANTFPSLSNQGVAIPDLLSSSAFPPIIPFGSTASSLPASGFASMNIPPASIFTPGPIDTKAQNVPPPMFQPPPQNAPPPSFQSLPQRVPPPTFFNPQQADSLSNNAPSSSNNAPHPITQMPPMAVTEPPKPVAEPPKATGNVNFRMTKKRPQYYAGPIEGVGAISNNVKPIIPPVIPSAPPVEASNFQSALFTPEQPIQPAVEQYPTLNIEQASVAFDVNKPVEQVSSHAFDMSKPHENAYGTAFNMKQPESQNYEQEYNTPFDMSRDKTDPYNQPKQESRGFGIIGSLKSKLSSIDINKIQSTVTTFFDPAYNDSKVVEPIGQDNAPYQQQQFGQAPQGQNNFDIFVPEQNQYSQYRHTQDPYLQDQGQNQDMTSYSTSSYFTNTNYSTEQVFANNPLYDNTQLSNPAASSYNPQENIPEKTENLFVTSTENTTFYNPNAFTHESMTNPPIQPPVYDITDQNKGQDNVLSAPEIVQQNVNYFNSNMKPLENPTSNDSQQITNQQKTNVIGSKEASSMTYHDPNAFAQENRQIWGPQLSQDNFAKFSQPFDQHQKNAVSAASEKQEPKFYDPNAFAVGNQKTLKSQQRIEKEHEKDFTSNVHKTSSGIGIDYSGGISALDTSKYNIASIEKQQQTEPSNVPLLPAASFFDNPLLSTNLPQYPKINEIDFTAAHSMAKDTKPVELQEEQFEFDYSKTISKVPPPIGTKSQNEFVKAVVDNTDIKIENKHPVKAASLIETLSKDEIPVLAVSTEPLFGLSAIIADKSKEICESERPILFDTIHQSKSLFESNTASSFFENKEPENKIKCESQAKITPLDITALSINDAKNVLVIEPPQKNIGELLKRNASSNKLENLPETLPQYFKPQSYDSTSTKFQEARKINLGDSTTDFFFKHPYNTRELEEQDSQKVESVDEELNICETCREVSTPDHEQKHKEPEDLTSQLIENITSPIQLANPLTVPLTESDALIFERSLFDDQQLDEINQVAKETFETLQVQLATELLDKRTPSEIRDYGWTTEENVSPVAPRIDHDYASQVDSVAVATKHDYDFESDVISATNLGQEHEFKNNPTAMGFIEKSLDLDDLPVPNNASDEIKAEIKHSHEDIVLPRQMSIPTAPPEEKEEDAADPHMDEPGVLDVHSIEQDAKKDFPLEEEFIIEPSTDEFLSTDDDKIEFRERKRSSEDSSSNDTFTNRIDKFKKKIDNPVESTVVPKPRRHSFKKHSHGSPPIPMASYFDTGNYAVESHFRNSLVAMGIPPGFEEEYARKLSGISLGSIDNIVEPYIPETSTQTRAITTPTYSSSYEKETMTGFPRRKENDENFAHAFIESMAETATVQTINKPTVVQQQIASVFADTTPQTEEFPQNVQPLPNSRNFFSANVEESKPAEPAAAEGFSRLASYFSIPPAQPEHSKSFFELSQSQNHYRHEPKTQDNQKSFFELSQSQNHYIDDDTKKNIKELMKDLTSPQNINTQIVKTVNYFTVELDNEIKHNTNAAPINIKIDEINGNKNIKSEIKVTKPVENDSKNKNKDEECDDILKCKYCRRYIPDVNTKVFVVKTAVNEPSGPSSEAEMPSHHHNTGEKIGNNINLADFDVEKQAEDNVTLDQELRNVSEYTPVKHHWFYRVDIEEKSVWRGFSNVDSAALEKAHESPELNENTLVATDGGRYDVNVVGRLRIAVYWKEKPTNVRRCSWFYKGTTDARYVPYTESVADILEEEYRHGITTGEWHRKMVLPNNEMVIMHGPAVMVHFLQSGTSDGFSTPPQVAARPRVVRRSHEESEIEESEPSKIDHLLLLCHGVGSACDMRFRSVEEVVEDFRATSLQLLQSHYRNSYDSGLVSRVEVLPISWHEQLHSGETGVDRRLARVTLDSIPRLRAFTNHTVLDVLFYTSPVFHQTIIDTVCFELNRVYSMFQQRNPDFKGDVSLGGHSLGSVILYDLLCNQIPQSLSEQSKSSQKTYAPGAAPATQSVKYPELKFPPAALYALGSPIAIFECIRGVESLGLQFALPTCRHFFNIFHPYDPIAYRIEPLINPQLQEVKPSQIPHHKGRKRMHLELKDTMVRVGADLKQKLVESLRTTWNKWKSTPPLDGQLEKVVEEEAEREQLANEDKSGNEIQATREMLGHLNSGRRVDFVLQEAPLEMINEYLFAMSSHVGYWESEDTMLLMLREIYDSLGVQPDSTVPQQSMTLERTKTVPQDETHLINQPDFPSTSRGGT